MGARVAGTSSAKIRTYKDLIVWQKACRLCVTLYEATGKFPAQEKFGLTAQIRRSSVSIPSNIAEGYGRHSKPDYIRFLQIAYGSYCELETQLLIARQLGYLEAKPFTDLEGALGEVERMLSGLIRSLKAKTAVAG
jgi:four helix bundle protein